MPEKCLDGAIRTRNQVRCTKESVGSIFRIGENFYKIARHEHCYVFGEDNRGSYYAEGGYELSWISGPRLMNGERPK